MTQQSHKSIMRLVASALFMALIFLMTLISWRIPGVAGAYIHPGDSMIYACAWFVGGPLGGAAAGLGSMLADLTLGSVQYMIPTLIIKFLMGGVCAMLFRALPDKWWGYILAMLPGALIMIVGYSAYEWMVAGIGAVAVTIVPGIIQGVGGIAIAMPIIIALKKLDALKSFRDVMKG